MCFLDWLGLMGSLKDVLVFSGERVTHQHVELLSEVVTVSMFVPWLFLALWSMVVSVQDAHVFFICNISPIEDAITCTSLSYTQTAVTGLLTL